MRRVRTRDIAALACAASLLTLCACGDDESGTSDPTSSATASTSATSDDEHAMEQVRAIDKQLRAADPSKPLPEDATWATDGFRTRFDAAAADFTEAGAVFTGKITTESLHLGESDPDAPGGGQLTAYACTVDTTRIIVDGKDVTAHPNDPTKVLPKKPRHDTYLNTYSTTDDGTTWQLDRSRNLPDKDKKGTPCDA